MEEITTNVELEEESLETVDEGETVKMSDDDLKSAIEAQMSKIRNQGMTLGFQVSCSSILQKITVVLKKPGKKSYRDYERLIDEIQKFCETALSRKNDEDKQVSPVEDQE